MTSGTDKSVYLKHSRFQSAAADLKKDLWPSSVAICSPHPDARMLQIAKALVSFGADVTVVAPQEFAEYFCAPNISFISTQRERPVHTICKALHFEFQKEVVVWHGRNPVPLNNISPDFVAIAESIMDLRVDLYIVDGISQLLPVVTYAERNRSRIICNVSEVLSERSDEVGLDQKRAHDIEYWFLQYANALITSDTEVVKSFLREYPVLQPWVVFPEPSDHKSLEHEKQRLYTILRQAGSGLVYTHQSVKGLKELRSLMIAQNDPQKIEELLETTLQEAVKLEYSE